MTWEYSDHWWYVSHTDASVEGDGSQAAELNRWGQLGWELVSVTAAPRIVWESPSLVQYAGSYTDGVWYHAFFKRPLDSK